MRAAWAPVIAVAVALAGAAPAQAEETVKITRAGFSPNHLGAPTNAFGSADIGNTTGALPAPIRHANIFGPAGVTLDLKGTGTCTEQKLLTIGPQACPANSKAGFGGGEGAYLLAGEIIKEKYTLDFFLADNHPGHVTLLAFLKGSSPVSVEVVFPGKVITGPKPYGLGISLEVPEIKVLPEASPATATSAFISLGAHNVAYYRRVHGKRKLFHVRGIVLPSRCPHGGWPVASQLFFEDGDSIFAKQTIPCPK